MPAVSTEDALQVLASTAVAPAPARDSSDSRIRSAPPRSPATTRTAPLSATRGWRATQTSSTTIPATQRRAFATRVSLDSARCTANRPRSMGTVLAALVISWAAVAFLGWLLYLMVRQQGRVLLAQEELRKRLADLEVGLQLMAERPVPSVPQTLTAPPSAPAQAAPLSVGSAAPEICLAQLDGR